MTDIKQITCEDALKMVKDDKAVLIDVREPEEFAGGHIPYALSLPMSQLEKAVSSCDFPAGKALIFQCQGGVRSQRVCDYVSQTKCWDHPIYNLIGGYNCWKDEKNPVL